MFPTRDLIDGHERLLERDRVHQFLLEAHPELTARDAQLSRSAFSRSRVRWMLPAWN